MFCPLRKYTEIENTEPLYMGYGYPAKQYISEKFAECIGEDCGWYDKETRACQPTYMDVRLP